MTKRVAIYARISTIWKWQNLETQTNPLEMYVEQRWWNLFNIYSDQISGSKESRDGLDELMKDAHKRKFDVVLVFRFDRMSRSTKHLISTLDTFRLLWIDFVSYSEAVDTSTSTGKLMFSIISSFAEFEKNIIIERVRAGLERAKKEWKILWRPSIKVDTDQIINLRNQWLSMRNIWLRMWISKSKVERSLKSVK